MKANEIMVGDWVYLPSIMSDDKYPVQVLEIQDDCIKYYGGGKKMMVLFEHIEPIPLTPEILEKNGFVDERSNYAYRTDNYHVCYYCADEKLSINKYGAILDVHCFYVHQLQHALRLCEITLNIEV